MFNYFHVLNLLRPVYLKSGESSTRQGCAIIWNFQKYWGMTHLLRGGGGPHWRLQTMLCFYLSLLCGLFFFFFFCLGQRRRNHEGPRLNRPCVTFDLEMFHMGANMPLFVLVFDICQSDFCVRRGEKKKAYRQKSMKKSRIPISRSWSSGPAGVCTI